MNHPITNINSVTPTMSSREIADLTGKRHDHVLRDIRAMFADLGLSPNFGEKVEPTGGRPSTVYHLDRDLTDCLLTGYSAKARMRVIKRWRELEQQSPALPDFSNPAVAARAWADEVEKNQTLQIQNQQQAQQIESLQNLFVDGMTPTEFAKRLNGVNCRKINQELFHRHWLYQYFAGGWRVSSYARDRYLTERQSNVPRSSGQVMVRCTPVLLRKGALYIHRLYLDRELPMKGTWDGQFTHDKALQGAA